MYRVRSVAQWWSTWFNKPRALRLIPQHGNNRNEETGDSQPISRQTWRSTGCCDLYSVSEKYHLHFELAKWQV